jgi:hypothetical protein
MSAGWDAQRQVTGIALPMGASRATLSLMRRLAALAAGWRYLRKTMLDVIA